MIDTTKFPCSLTPFGLFFFSGKSRHAIGHGNFQVKKYNAYFQSLYFREPNGLLFELATDEPGFTADEPLDQLGERLSLPPFLETRRREIEAGLKPLA